MHSNDASGIHFVKESLRVGFVFRDDRIGVPRTVLVNVVNRLVEAIDCLHVHDQIEVFGTESRIRSSTPAFRESL